MANDYFQFKQFRVDQADCGMKVTTEACIFGAVIDYETSDAPASILDIGSGTGLLSLMTAQRFQHSHITGVEIDEDAYRQSTDNAIRSPWADHLKFVCNDIDKFAESTDKQFDLIISNPPFFKKHHQPIDYKKAHALHADTLTQETLTAVVDKLLSPEGEFHVLLPEYESRQLHDLIRSKGLFLNQSLKVFNTTGSHSIFRVINTFSRHRGIREVRPFYIRNEHNQYTDQFVDKLSPYYLHL